MVKTKTVGYLLFGIFVVWYLIGSGTGLKYTQNIARMPAEYQYRSWLSEQPPLDKWLIENFYGTKLQWK